MKRFEEVGSGGVAVVPWTLLPDPSLSVRIKQISFIKMSWKKSPLPLLLVPKTPKLEFFETWPHLCMGTKNIKGGRRSQNLRGKCLGQGSK